MVYEVFNEPGRRLHESQPGVQHGESRRTPPLDIEEPNADTVGGLVMNRPGRMPVVGDVVADDQVRFWVEPVRRVSRQLAQPAALDARDATKYAQAVRMQ